MAEMTQLDMAHAAMQKGGDAARLRFYERLADTDLFVLLECEATGQDISPQVFEVAEGRFVLAFDLQERLVAFTRRAAFHAGVPGRVLMQMLQGQGVGLGLNLEVAASSILIPATAVDWLSHTLGQAPDRVVAQITSYAAPTSLPGALIGALEEKLTSAAGLASGAYLVGVTYTGGARGILLGFVGADPGAEAALAKAAGEVMSFAGIEVRGLDIGFFAPDDPVVARLISVGRRVEVPRAALQTPKASTVPGTDPDKPPILR